MAKLGPLPDVQNGVKIRLLGKTPSGTNWANVLHAKVTGSLTQTTLDTVANSIGGFWLSRLGPACIITTALQTVEVTDISTRNGLQGISTTGWNGTLSGTALPAQVAVCLSLKVAQHYRGGHPRMYLPGVGSTATTNGSTLASAFQSNYTSWGRLFRQDINGITTGATTWQLAAVSYYHKVNGQEAYKNPPDLYVITDVVCHGRLDTMRRRLGKEST